MFLTKPRVARNAAFQSTTRQYQRQDQLQSQHILDTGGITYTVGEQDCKAGKGIISGIISAILNPTGEAVLGWRGPCGAVGTVTLFCSILANGLLEASYQQSEGGAHYAEGVPVSSGCSSVSYRAKGTSSCCWPKSPRKPTPKPTPPPHSCTGKSVALKPSNCAAWGAIFDSLKLGTMTKCKRGRSVCLYSSCRRCKLPSCPMRGRGDHLVEFLLQPARPFDWYDSAGDRRTNCAEPTGS